MWTMGDNSGWWMFSGWLWMIVFWALVIWAITKFVSRDDSGRQRDGVFEAEPLKILERRYANGELSDEQFEEMRTRLLERSGRRPGQRPASDPGSPAS